MAALSNDEVRHFDEQDYLIIWDVLDKEAIDRIAEVGDRQIASDRKEDRFRSEE